MGYSNHIGSDRRDAGWIKTNTSFGVTLVEAIASGNSTPASSLIRAEIEAGDIQSAITLLGHSFTVRGTVVRGNQIGRTIGFPTANISPLEPSQLLPPDGAYAVDIHIDGTTMRGMANTGHRPTLNDGRDKTLEVNIFDFDSDIYGQTIDISFLRRLRPETAFSSSTLSKPSSTSTDRTQNLSDTHHFNKFITIFAQIRNLKNNDEIHSTHSGRNYNPCLCFMFKR